MISIHKTDDKFKTTKSTKGLGLAITACVTVLAATMPNASAQTEDAKNDWRLADLVKDSDSSKFGRALLTADTSVPGVMFFCPDDKFAAAISMDPVDLEQVVVDTGNMKSISVKYEIGTDTKGKASWLLATRYGTFLPGDRAIAKKIYNAVVRGDEIKLNPASREETTLNFPAPDVADFVEFQKGCDLRAKS